MTAAKEELRVADLELRRCVEKRTGAELDVTELRERAQAGEERLAGVAGDRVALDRAVAETRAKIDAVKPKVATAAAREETAESEIGEVNRRLQVLHQRQGRGAQFKTKKERDEWLGSQVADADATADRKRARRWPSSRTT